MRSRVTYLSVMQLALAKLHGAVDPDEDERNALVVLINQVTQDYWLRAWWPEIMHVERRAYRAVWASATAYAAGDEVFHRPSQAYYIALRASTGEEPAESNDVENSAYWGRLSGTYSNDEWDSTADYEAGDRVYYPPTGLYYQCHSDTTAQQAPTDTDYWGALAIFVKDIDPDQTGQTAIGMVEGVYGADPRLDPNARAIAYYETQGGIIVTGDHPEPWLHFKEPTPEYTGTDWSATATYAAADQMYFSDGDYYQCLSATSAGESPTTHPTKWQRLDYPTWLRGPVAQYVYGEMLKAGGNRQTGNLEQAAAEKAIRRQMEAVQQQQRNVLKVRTE